MAHRRESESVGPPQPPAELTVCVVEEWAGPGEVTADGVEDAAVRLQALAWRRWRRARGQWADQAGVDWREVPGGGRTPRWRAA